MADLDSLRNLKRQTKINVSSNHRLPSSIRMLTILSQYSLVKEVVSLSYNCCCCYCFSVLRTQGNRAEDSVGNCSPNVTLVLLSPPLSLSRKKKQKKALGRENGSFPFPRVLLFPLPSLRAFLPKREVKA